MLDITEDVLFKWRVLAEEGRKSGHTFSQPDLFIAATALHHGMTVVSRHTREFELARVPVFNPEILSGRCFVDFTTIPVLRKNSRRTFKRVVMV